MSTRLLDQRALAELGQQLRVDAVRCSAMAGSGHPTSAMSAADLMAVLLAEHLRYDFAAPENPANDHLIFSKGHAAPLLYAMYVAAGAITDEELLTFRKIGSHLEGHPTTRLPWVDVATGSLGQGLPIGAGVALAGRRLDHLPYQVWVLCGDGELAEGSMWEAFEQAGHDGLDNLTAIIDVNRLGQRGPTRHSWDTPAYARRIAAFGWHTIEIDGHDIDQINRAYREARTTAGRPTAILARTRKGKGVTAVEDKEGQHGQPLAEPEVAITELGGRRHRLVEVTTREPVDNARRIDIGALRLPEYRIGEQVATRTAFGQTLAALGAARADVVALDGEVANSTGMQAFADRYPDRFVQCHTAEQQLIATAVGLRVRGWNPYVSTFAAFFTRAYDFIRMAGISRVNLRLVGSHAGVSIGQDGPSQMGLEDLACLRAVYGSTVLYPCDANQTAQLTAAMADQRGICYLRTTRGDTPVIYGPDERFAIGGSRVLRSSADDRITVVAAGITVPEALTAADRLAGEGIAVRVIDLYTVKPIDAPTLWQAARETGRLVTVEDHWPQGGLGDAVLESVAILESPPRVTKLAPTELPGSATPAEQLRLAGISAEAIAAAVRINVGA